MKSPFTCSHWGEQNYRVVLKNFLFCKRPLHSFGQRGPKCTPIFGLFLEKFFKKKFTLHLFGIRVSKRNLFLRKNFEKGQKNLPAGSGGRLRACRKTIIRFISYQIRPLTKIGCPVMSNLFLFWLFCL